MSIERHISTTQITLIVGSLLGLALAVMMGSAIGGQDFQRVALVLGAFLGLGTFLALGKNYWLLIPFSLGANFPAVPLAGRSLEFPELAIAGCTLFFLLRVATRKEKMQVFHSVNIRFLVFIAWVGMVFAINPIGLAMLGSNVGGGRFYLKLGLAFAAFFILSNRTYSEKDIKWVLGLLVFGAFFSMIFGIARYAALGPQIDPTTGMVIEQFYSWHQVLSLPAITIAFLIFARWSPQEIFTFQRPHLILVYAVCLLFVLLSGKRMALVAAMLAPLISAVMYRQFRYVLIALIMVLAGIFGVVAGQGQWFKLPLVAQRTLSWLPGDWDPELQSMAGGTDEWRAELRRIALANIQQDPIVGRGFAVDLQETMTAIGMQMRGGDMEIQVAAYALGRSWHNTWLGYAADFGIPFSLIQAVLWTSILILSARVFATFGNRSAFGVMALYVFMYTCRDFVASWTSGHSALDAFDRWWMYGIVVAIYFQAKSYRKPVASLRLGSSERTDNPTTRSLTLPA
jgi:hypothetical protein